MLKIMNPYQRETVDNESVAFRISPMACACNVVSDTYTSVYNASPPGSGYCGCTCIGEPNRVANRTAAYDRES